MTFYQSFSTLTLPPQERAYSWKAYLEESLFEAEFGLLGSAGIEAEHAAVDLNSHALHAFAIGRHSVDRTSSELSPIGNKLYFTVILGGQACFWSETEMHVAEPGDVLVYDPDRPFLIAFHDDTRELLFEVDQRTLGGDMAYIGESPKKLTSAALRFNGLTIDDLRSLYVGMRNREARPRFQHADPERALETLVNSVTGGTSSDYFDEARRAIQQRLNDPELSLTTIARAVSLSVRHLSRVFQAHGTSVAQCIIAERVHLASTLLRTTNASLTEIALNCGFASASHFSRTFNRVTSETPTQHRKRAQHRVTA